MKLVCPRIGIVELILLELDRQADILGISFENGRVIPHVLLICIFHPVLSRARVMKVVKAEISLDALLYH